jgi:PAS domain S-box-containing protein
MTGLSQFELMAVTPPLLLLAGLIWRGGWSWLGLCVAVCFGISVWGNLCSLLAHLFETPGPSRESMGSAIFGLVLFAGGMIGAMRKPSALWTFFMALAAMEVLFVSVIPLYRFAFGLDEGTSFAINGRGIPNATGAVLTVVFALVPMMIGIPWMLARQSASDKSVIAPALARYGLLSGAGVAAFMIISTCFVAWGYIGRGPFSGEPQSPAFEMAQSTVLPNMIFGLLMGVIIILFWSFPKRFFDPVVTLLEASQDIHTSRLEDRAHALWRGIARKLDETRSEAVSSQMELNRLRSLLVTFFDTSPADMFVKTVDGRLIYCSPALANVLGRTQAEMIGMQESDYHEPEHLARVRQIDRQLIESRKPIVQEVFNPAFNRHELQTRFPILNEAGEVTHIGAMFINIDDRVKAQQEQKKAEGWLEAFIRNAPVPMVLADPATNRYLFANSVASEFYDITAAELLASDPRDAQKYWPRWDEDMAPAIKRVLVDRQAQIVETLIQRKREGTIANYLVSLFPIDDGSRKLPLMASVGVDITAIRQAEQELAAAQTTLHQSEKLAALGQLLAGVAHELNNPLAIVLGRASILKDKLADTPHADSLQKLRDAADRCARIVKTFLAMARQTGPRRELVQINELIEGALDMTGYGLRTSRIDLVLDLDQALPAIEADEDQIVQLLINLIINAQHALDTKEGDRRLTVRTRLDRRARQAVIEVADNGPGVPADVAGRIFEPFFTTKDVGTGTGLGLSVCKSLVEAHGGTLSLHPNPGGGACFRATLALLEATGARGTDAAPARQGAAGHALIVDDEPEVAAILADCLAPLGLSAEIASDGQAALDLIARSRFDLVFCDVRMPVMDGLTFHARLKAEHPKLAGRLAFVSGDVLHRDIARLQAASDQPIIEKPFDPQTVRDTALALLAPEGEAR